MVFIEVAVIFLGFAVLTAAAGQAIKNLIKISRHYGMSEFFISFVLVGIISISPELIIGINSALQGSSSFGLGIVFGSNIADLTLIIGLVALASHSTKLHKGTIKQTNSMLLVIILPVLFLFDGEISRLEGAFLFAMFLIYLFKIIQQNKPKNFIQKQINTTELLPEIMVLLAAIIAMFLSGHLITEAAETISSTLALPIFFVGILIAMGTCLPELTFALKAGGKKHTELGFGDILGNVLADSTATIGIIAIISPIRPPFPQLAIASGIFMVISIGIVLLIFNYKKEISKKDGLYLIMLYAVILSIQVLLEKTPFGTAT